jgi:hypothetical protein
LISINAYALGCASTLGLPLESTSRRSPSLLNVPGATAFAGQRAISTSFAVRPIRAWRSWAATNTAAVDPGAITTGLLPDVRVATKANAARVISAISAPKMVNGRRCRTVEMVSCMFTKSRSPLCLGAPGRAL